VDGVCPIALAISHAGSPPVWHYDESHAVHRAEAVAMPDAFVPTVLRYLRTLGAGQSANGQSDRHLVATFTDQRDEIAFAALMERHGPMVLGVCGRILHDEHLAEDVFQATFLALARHARSIRKQQAVASWLHGVALRLAHKANAQATRANWPDVRDRTVTASDPPGDAVRREAQTVLDDELQRLPAKYRMPLVLCYLEGQTRDEAAARLGWTVGQLKGNLERGRDRLRARLVRRGVTLAGAGAATLLTDLAHACAVPPLLAVATVRAGVRVAAGSPLTGCGVAASVIALTMRGAHTMMRAKLLLVLAASVLLTASIGIAVGYLTQPTAGTPIQGAIDGPPAAANPSPGPAEADQERRDLYGDPLPPGAVARLGTTRFRTPFEAHAIAFAPDGKTVAVSSRGGLFLFDARTGKRLKRLGDFFPFQDRPENSLAFSPDGKRLAARGHVMLPPTTPLNAPAIPPLLQVWELDRIDKPRAYDPKDIVWIGWSPQSEPIGVYQEKDGVSLRNLQSGQSHHFACPKLHRPEFLPCACAPAALLVIADQQGTIHAWNTATGTKRYTLETEQDRYVYGMAVSADGRHVAVLRGKHGEPASYTVPILEGPTGRVLHTVATAQRNLRSVAFSLDGKTLATVALSGIRFWDIASGREISRSRGDATGSTIAAFAGDGQTLATLTRDSGIFETWEVATGKRKAAPVGHAAWPHGAAFSPDGRRVATGATALDGTIHIWDLATSKSLRNIHRPYKWVRDVAWSRDGRWLYSTWTDDEVWISDAVSGERMHVIKLEDPDRPEMVQSAISMHLSADDKTLTAFSHYHAKDSGNGLGETLITGWDPATRKQLFRRRSASTDWGTAVSPDARLLALPNLHSAEKHAGFGPMRLEDLATGKLLLTFPSPPDGTTRPLIFARDSRLLASWNYNPTADPTRPAAHLILWEVATAQEVLSLPTAGQSRAAFSPDGRLMAVPAPPQTIPTRPQTILVWDLARGKEHRRFRGFDGEISWLAFTPDSSRLISGHSDSTLLVWEVPPAPARKARPGPDAIAQAWADLAGDDAPRAFRARWTLVSAPEVAVPLFAKHLQPAPPADAKQLAALVADLDGDQYAIRAAAQKQLEELGESAVPALRQILAKGPSLELRRRAEALLDRLRGPITDPEQRRKVRAVAALEDAATPAARKLLAALAAGAAHARLTQEAQAALRRLR
jgi:RNA polymerase sigma factor (sigma-70 family)